MYKGSADKLAVHRITSYIQFPRFQVLNCTPRWDVMSFSFFLSFFLFSAIRNRSVEGLIGLPKAVKQIHRRCKEEEHFIIDRTVIVFIYLFIF